MKAKDKREPSTVGAANVSACGRYRYTLTRDWSSDATGSGKGRVLFVMLNPSTADAAQDDPTIRKCVGFAQRWGYTSVEVVNLFAWRATKPADLVARMMSYDVEGVENDGHIYDALKRAWLVVAAWGEAGGTMRHGNAKPRWVRVLNLIQQSNRRLVALKLSKDGHPWHPLYVPYDVTPVPFEGGSR